MQNTTATWTPARIIETTDGVLVGCSCHHTPFPATMVDAQGRCLWSRDFDEDTRGAWLASRESQAETPAEVEQEGVEEVIESSQIATGMFIERKTYQSDGRGYTGPASRIARYETVRIVRQTKNLKDRAIYEVVGLSGSTFLMAIGHGRTVTRVHIENNTGLMEMVAKGVIYTPKSRW